MTNPKDQEPADAFDPLDDNLRWWEERAAFHLDTPLYREMVARLEAGRDTFLVLDDAVLGDVKGLDVLHLQCHVGTETLSFARRGARVTGADFSAEALRQAARLAKRFDLPARYVLSSIEELPQHLDQTFDLVYTSYGALCWMDDLDRWARVAARFVAPGGRLVVIDGHPLSTCLEEKCTPDDLRLVHPYLRTSKPLSWDTPGSYAAQEAETTHNRVHQWTFGLGDVVQAVVDSGLVVTRLAEHPVTFFPLFPWLVAADRGLWELPPPLQGRYPLTFTLVASRIDPASMPAKP